METNPSTFKVDQAEKDRFLDLLNRCADACKRNDIKVLPYKNRDLPSYCRLPIEHRKFLLNSFGKYVSLFEDFCASHSGSGSSSLKFLWYFLSQSGFKIDSELMGLIEEQHLIEVYDAESRQIFRSWNFFTICSHTLEDVLCCPWYDLFERDESITAGILEIATQTLSGQRKGVQRYNLPVHDLREKGSSLLFHARVENLFCYRLLEKAGKIGGVLNVNSVVSAKATVSAR